jgi:hypothetical protein
MSSIPDTCAEEADPRPAQRRATPAARTHAPIFAHARSSSSIVPGDGVVGDPGARERARDLGHAAGRAVASHSPVSVLA